MRKKVWCNQGDIVLVSLRDFQAGVQVSGFGFRVSGFLRLELSGFKSPGLKVCELEEASDSTTPKL